MNDTNTPFEKVFDVFLSKITDDMYMELEYADTIRLLGELLVSAVPSFEFPRKSLSYVVTSFGTIAVDEIIETEGGEKEIETRIKKVPRDGYFNSTLNSEEINVIATYMIVQWLGQQLASVEMTRMKYSGSDFKFTSQANHMQKLLQLKNDYQREGFHLQRLYKRRKRDENGIPRSTFGQIMQTPKSWKEGSDDY